MIELITALVRHKFNLILTLLSNQSIPLMALATGCHDNKKRMQYLSFCVCVRAPDPQEMYLANVVGNTKLALSLDMHTKTSRPPQIYSLLLFTHPQI